MLTTILKFLKALNANTNPSEIAHAACLGVMLGFMPKNNVLWYLILVFFLFVRINKPFQAITIIIVSQFAWRLDPFFDQMGYAILNMDRFVNIFARLIDIPFVGFTKFNNTIVMGSFAFSLAIYIPLFIIFRVLIMLWRKYVSPFLIKTPLVKHIVGTPLIGKLSEIDFE